MKVAIIGAGRIGGVHLGAYQMMSDVEVTAIADVDTSKAAKKANSEKVRIYKSIDDLLDNEKVDMIDICTPTYLHPEHAIKAMERGVHVLCEKPISLDVENGQKMITAAVKNNVCFMVAHVIRFWPEYMFLKKVCDEKTYGVLKYACFSRISSRPSWSWEEWMMDIGKSGRAPVDLHIHDVDFMLYLLGMPIEIAAQHIEDGMNISHISTCFKYENAFIDIEGAWYNAPIPFTMMFRACFENTVLEFKDNILMLYENGNEAKKVDVEESIKKEVGINIDSITGYFNEIRYFIECIKQNIQPEMSTPKSSLASLEIVIKELEAARKNQKIVL